MAVKFNDSTNLRPEGERILDAPLVSIDLNDFCNQVKKEKPFRESDRNAMTVYKNSQMRIVLIALHEDTIIPRHKAEGVISVHVLDGKIKFSTDSEEMEMGPGRMVTLHKGIPHTVKGLKESVFLLTIAK